MPSPQVCADDAASPAAKSYEKVSGVDGNLNSIGSDTLNNLMTYWAEAFSKLYPNVKIQVEGKGSATAPPALTEGTAQLGPMSRKMKPEEEDAFEKKHGFQAHADQRGPGLPGRVRPQGQPDPRTDARPSRLHFLEDPQERLSATSPRGARPA